MSVTYKCDICDAQISPNAATRNTRKKTISNKPVIVIEIRWEQDTYLCEACILKMIKELK